MKQAIYVGVDVSKKQFVCNAEELSHFNAVKMSHSGLVPCSLFPEILDV